MGLTLSATPTPGAYAAKGTADDAVVTEPLPAMRFVVYPLLNALTGKGLQAEYTFGRYDRQWVRTSPSVYGCRRTRLPPPPGRPR